MIEGLALAVAAIAVIWFFLGLLELSRLGRNRRAAIAEAREAARR
jgi:hypothetical protein